MVIKKIFKNHKSSLILLLSIVIGTIIGLIMKEDAVVLKPFGDIFLNMLLTIIVPLVFVSIASAIANMTDLKKLGKILKNSILIFIVIGIIAAIFMIVLVKIYNPANGVSLALDTSQEIEKVSVGQKIVETLSVSDFSSLLTRSNMMPLIIFSIFFGIAMSALGKKVEGLKNVLDSLTKVMMKLIKYLMYYAPIGICAYFAALIGQYGSLLIEGYVKSIILYVIASILYFLIFYTLYAYISAGKIGVKRFYKYILPSVATSFATQSSMASLPTNMETAKNIGISKDIRELVLPIGATMNKHGTIIGSILKIAFLFTIFGKPFGGLDTFLIAILISVMSGVVMSGIPAGGFLGEMLIVSLYNFPSSAFLIISTIGLIIDAPATTLNVVDDISSSMLVSRSIEGKNWLKENTN